MNNEKIWTKEKNFLLKEFYSNKGSEYCANLLNLTRKQVRNKANKLNIKLSKEIKNKTQKENAIKGWQNVKPKRFNVNYKFFIENFTKESVYILGFLWADGYFNNKSQSHSIILEIIKNDMDEIKNIFLKTGKWLLQNRYRKNKKPQSRISCNNFIIYNFLKENDYLKRSDGANKILQIIPKNLHQYWWRGYTDGDGCLYSNYRNNGQFQIFWSSCYNQNWNFVESLLKLLKVNYNIKRQERGKYHSSLIISCGRNNFKQIGNYLYKNYDNIGLTRKYNKYTEFQKKIINLDKV